MIAINESPPRDTLAKTKLAILAIALALTVVGILFVHSTTSDGAPFPSGRARGQILKALAALAALWAVRRIDYRHLERSAYLLYIALAVVLLGMLAVRASSGGVNRFISLYVFQVQPSEITKLGLILALARYLRYREDQRRVSGLIGPFLLTLLPMVLVLLQPNLGLSLMFPPILVAMLFTAGSKPRHLMVAVVLGVALLPAAYFLNSAFPLLRDYQRNRLESFVVRDRSNARNQGYQLDQSLIAVGSGGLVGKGYGAGTQNTLKHLPEKHTDFIFSIIAEELGFVGAASVVILFMIFAALIIRVAIYTREPFGRLVTAGIGVAFAAQCFENIGMTIGITPITGIALPFISLAGSNLVASYLAVGIVLAVASRRVRVVATRDLDPPDARRLFLLQEDRPAGLLQARWPVD
jgi:rod shape determining protein RodA